MGIEGVEFWGRFRFFGSWVFIVCFEILRWFVFFGVWYGFENSCSLVFCVLGISLVLSGSVREKFILKIIVCEVR